MDFSPTPRYLRARLGLYYAGVFASVGVFVPFWPLWLEAQGLNAAEIGVVMAAAIAAKIASNPLVGHAVDRLGRRRHPMILLGVASLVAYALFPLVHGFWAILALNILASALFAAIMPLGENVTMLAAGRHGFQYGRVRLWGSLAFIVCAWAGGHAVGLLGTGSVLPMVILSLFALVAVIALLPEIATPPASSGETNGAETLGQLLADPAFRLFLLTGCLIQIGHMIYYGFATLHWRAAGHDEGTIGLLWAEGVLAEVVLFLFGGRVLSRLGPARLMLLAALGGVVRWTVVGMTTALPALLAVQTLHALTFGAMHLGAMHFLAKAVPAKLSARAQGFYSSITMGVAPGLAMLASGALYAALGGKAFLVAAAVTLLAALAAMALIRVWQEPD
ncbi:MAG: MFS transporter [Rhodospirillales bacterium]|nr:MFS transporter [Rhodospirillales bacterium]